jgi:hypothetical protein
MGIEGRIDARASLQQLASAEQKLPLNRIKCLEQVIAGMGPDTNNIVSPARMATQCFVASREACAVAMAGLLFTHP